MPMYDREILKKVLVRHWPTSTSGCTCGQVPLGGSYPGHVADVYEDKVAQRKAERLLGRVLRKDG